MKKLITLFSILFVFVLVSCEKNETTPDQQAAAENNKEVNFEKLFKIEKGVLSFTDKKSFDKLNEYIFSSKSNSNELDTYLKGKSFNNLYSFYKNLQEEDLQTVFETKRVEGELAKYLILKTDPDGDLDLSEKVKESFLQLYFNKDLSFKIGQDYIRIINDQLVFEKADGAILNFKVDQRTKNLKTKSVLGKSDYMTYENNGRKFKLLIETDNYFSGYVTLWVNGANVNFWNYSQYRAIHKRRWAGVYYRTNTQEMEVYGDHYFANPVTNSASWINFTSGILYDNSDAGQAQNYINSYNATARCRDFDGVDHFVSVSETF